MILSHGNEGTHAAGYVISGFSNLVMSGDFVIGLIVFMILIIVNFIVITKGATRIAEVGARFTLDAIPGKQMSIDADLSAGVIDDKTAQLRRRELEEESSFFGSMDGASKFVRGDAIAGLIITFINIVGGITIGYFRHGMDLGEASDVFIKLSVGDGLVTQIPALIVSLAAGLLVSKGGTRGSADKAVFGQLGAYPRALYVAARAAPRAGPDARPADVSVRHARRRDGGTRLHRPAPGEPPDGRRGSVEEAGSGQQGRRGEEFGQGLARHRRDRASDRQAALDQAHRRASGTRLPHVEDAQEVRHAIRLRRARGEAHRRLRNSVEELPDQGPRHGRRRTCHARRRGHGAARQPPRAGHSRAKKCASRPSACAPGRCRRCSPRI